MHKCHYCGIAFASEESKSNHQKTHKAGRPCTYCKDKEGNDKKAEKYLQDCIKATNDGKLTIPYIEELAVFVYNVDLDTVNNWMDKKLPDSDEFEHPELFGTIKRLKDAQKLLLLRRTTGRFNPSGAIFQLKANHGMIETEKRILTGDKEKPMSIALEFIPADDI